MHCTLKQAYKRQELQLQILRNVVRNCMASLLISFSSCYNSLIVEENKSVNILDDKLLFGKFGTIIRFLE